MSCEERNQEANKSKSIYEGLTSEHIKPEFQDQYTHFVLPISKELARLETYLSLITRIIKCRFDKFGGLHSSFWNLFVYSMIESSISILYRIAYDKNKNSVTVFNVRNKVKSFLATGEGVKDFEQEMEKIDQEEILESYEEDFRNIRDKKIAHLDQRNLDTYLPEHLRDFSEILESLNHICTQVKKYYARMCFGYQLEVLQFDSKIMPDVLIDGLVKRVLKDSPVINLPENMPDGWRIYRTGLSEDLLVIFNSNRTLVSLPTVT